MASIELIRSIYITRLISSLFCISLYAVISAVWMDASSGSAPRSFIILKNIYRNRIENLCKYIYRIMKKNYTFILQI